MASIKKRGDIWRARYRDDTDKEHTRHFARKADGQRWLDEQTAAQVTGLFVDPSAGRITFDAFFADWAQRQTWAPGTERAMRLAARTVTFGKIQMSALRRSHIEQWVKAMGTADRGKDRPRGLAPGTIKTRFNNVHTVLRAAVRDRLIATDPAAGVTLPRLRRAEAAMRLPTPEEVGRLIDATPPHLVAFVALAAFAGLRLGEAAAVQVGDVNFLGRTLQVTRQVQRAGADGELDIRPPKYGSERPVYLADELVAILADHVAEHRPGTDVGRWMFTGQDEARPPHQNSVGYWWRKARKAAGVHPELKLHDLRHFYASGLIAQGCDVVTVQRALGHASATVTLKTYAHLWPKAEDRTRNAASALIAETLAVRTADSLRTRSA